jgi:asparagine synthase (glutamine-hydrolysing)
MSSVDGQLCITFNGEIFNYVELRHELIRKGHRFVTRSDTEVILHLYQQEGERCVQRLNGQWAFAIWDVGRQRLFASRDRHGVQPFFYTRTADHFLFASEIKALRACPEVDCELDLCALDQIFTFWFTLPPRTAFKNVHQLPPGHCLVVENGHIRVWPYWNLEYAQGDDGGHEDTLAKQLLDLLRDAVRIRLRSDVPVAAYLSGGIDSTVVATLARVLVGDRLATFSVTFEDREFDESPFQREASTFLGTQHSDVYCSYADIARVFPQVVLHAEQPILRTAPAPLFLLAQLVRHSGFKVVLTGEGADEMLGGYDILKEAKIRRFWGRDLSSVRRPLLLQRLYPYMQAVQRQPSSYLARFFHVSPQNLHDVYFSHQPRWELTAKLKTFYSESVREQLCGYSALDELTQLLPGSFTSWDPFNQAEYLEAAFLLPGYILSSQGDRMAMAHSVEGRYPFLDHRVVEFCSHLSPTLKMKVLDQKHLLKVASIGLIPDSIRKRPKQPYRAPDGNSVLAAQVGYAQEMLSTAAIEKNKVFNSAAIGALVAKFAAGRAIGAKDNMAVIGVLSTQILLDQFAAMPRCPVTETVTMAGPSNSMQHAA